MTGLIEQNFLGLAVISEARTVISKLVTIDSAADFHKTFQAVRKYDNKTQERRDYRRRWLVEEVERASVDESSVCPTIDR